MPITQDSVLNLAKIDERLRRRVYDNIAWAPFIGNVVETGYVDDNGQKEYRASGSVIEKTDIKLSDGVDHAIITMENDLVGDPIYGDTQAEGTGEEYDFNHLRVFVNQTRKVVKIKSGNMSDLRSSKYRIRERARPKLEWWFVRQENAHITQAIYEGASGNLTAGLSEAENGIGLSARYPSNFYYQGSDGVFTVIGTAGKNKVASDITTAAGQTLTPMTTNTIEAASLLCQELNISQAVMYRGKPMWLWFISPYQLSYLRKTDSAWQADERAFVNGRGRDDESPLVQYAVNAYRGFLFFVDMQAVRPWNSTLSSFAGANGWRERGTYKAGEVQDCTYIIGKSAIAHANPKPYYIKEQTTDFEADIEAAGAVINGWVRNDFVSATDEANFFAKGNASKTVLSSEYSVVNNSLLVLMIDRA